MSNHCAGCFVCCGNLHYKINHIEISGSNENDINGIYYFKNGSFRHFLDPSINLYFGADDLYWMIFSKLKNIRISQQKRCPIGVWTQKYDTYKDKYTLLFDKKIEKSFNVSVVQDVTLKPAKKYHKDRT